MRPLPGPKAVHNLERQARRIISEKGYPPQSVREIVEWLWQQNHLRSKKHPVTPELIDFAATNLGIRALSETDPEAWNDYLLQKKQQQEQKRLAKIARKEAAAKREIELEQIRQEQKRLEAERKKKEREARDLRLANAAAALPKRNPKRTMALRTWEKEDLDRACKLGLISEKDVQQAKEEQAKRFTISYVAEWLRVLDSDVNRWAEDGRLPPAGLINLRMHGRWVESRIWFLSDLDRAYPKVPGWIAADRKAKKCRHSERREILQSHWSADPESFPSARHRKSLDMQAKAERLAQQQLEEKQRQKQEQQRQKRERERELEGIARHVALGDWTSWFGNHALGQRRLTAYLGPTNSGKTYLALEHLRKLPPRAKGIYLAPLRLLALEVCEDLRAQGIRASLITGEEQDIDPQARIVCSTIEMLNTDEFYDVAVIDELQLISDPQRGWAWTRSLLGVNANEVIVAGSLAVRPLLETFSESSNEPVDIHILERFQPLHVHAKHLSSRSVSDQSIFVVFSRNSVIRWGEYFRNQHRSVAQIYGAMPPELRRKEAERFRSGEAQILVATDAVALGLNLPAQTVIIGEGVKFNGKEMISLPEGLIRQIAGRAGRFGLHQEGWVAGADPDIHRQVIRALQKEDAPIGFSRLQLAPVPAWMVPMEELSADLSLREIHHIWNRNLSDFPEFVTPDWTDHQRKIDILDGATDVRQLPLPQRLSLAQVPIQGKNDLDVIVFRDSLRCVVTKKVSQFVPIERVEKVNTEVLEHFHRHVTLYGWFHFRYPALFPDLQASLQERQVIVAELERRVRSGLRRQCRSCGTTLSPQHPYAICDRCFHAQHRRDEWDERY